MRDGLSLCKLSSSKLGMVWIYLCFAFMPQICLVVYGMHVQSHVNICLDPGGHNPVLYSYFFPHATG
jgi:hypothetical protein